jgi:hypothetical protein
VRCAKPAVWVWGEGLRVNSADYFVNEVPWHTLSC